MPGTRPQTTAVAPSAEDKTVQEDRGDAVATPHASVRAIAGPTLVALAFFAGVALLAGSTDGFRFCELVHIGPRVQPSLLVPCEREAGPGYDGQFYFAIAHDPFLTRPETATSLDDSLRYRRILYPLTAWLLSAGQPAALPYALVLINVVAATTLVALAAATAVRAGRSAWWALLLAIFGGVWLPITRDLTEPLQLALLAAGMMTGSATLVLLAGFAKETAGVALTTETARGLLRRQRGVAVRFGAGALVLVAWVIFVRAAVHGSADRTLEGQFLRPPGAPLFVLADSLPNEPARFVVTAIALAICVLAIARIARVRDGAAVAGAAYAAVELGAGYDNWQEPLAVFRAMAGAVVLVYLSWCAARDRIGFVALVLAAGSGILSAVGVFASTVAYR